MSKIIEAQIETGQPYMLYKDSINKKSNQKNVGIIKSSNLCAEIVEYSDDKEHAVCNLASIGINHCLVPFKSRAQWIIYTKPDCNFCTWSKNFMDYHNFKYTEVEYNKEEHKDLNKYKEKSCDDNGCYIGKLTFPQIFYGKK